MRTARRCQRLRSIENSDSECTRSSTDTRLGRLDRKTQERIRSRVDELAENPFGHGTKQLTNRQRLRTTRIGDFRVMFAVELDRARIVIIALGPRGQVYREL